MSVKIHVENKVEGKNLITIDRGYYHVIACDLFKYTQLRFSCRRPHCDESRATSTFQGMRVNLVLNVFFPTLYQCFLFFFAASIHFLLGKTRL